MKYVEVTDMEEADLLWSAGLLYEWVEDGSDDLGVWIKYSLVAVPPSQDRKNYNIIYAVATED